MKNNTIPQIFPVFKKVFPYRLSRLGLLSAPAVKDINKTYTDSKETILHHEVKFGKDSSCSDILIAIIKMGGNVSLKDASGKKPLEYLQSKEVSINTLNSLELTLNHYKKDNNIIGLRLQRAKIEFLEGDAKKNATNDYLMRLDKCMHKLLDCDIVEFQNNISLFEQFLFKEYDENSTNDVNNTILNFFKGNQSPNFEIKLDAFINNAQLYKLKTLKMDLFDVGYENASNQNKKLEFVKKLAINYYPNSDLKKKILDRFNYEKEHIEENNKVKLYSIEKILENNKLFEDKSYVEPNWDDNTTKTKTKTITRTKTVTRARTNSTAKTKTTKEEPKTSTVSPTPPKEVYASEKFVNNLKKLSPEVRDGIDKCIEALKSGDTSGLNEHNLRNQRVGQFAVDVRGTGSGRGAGRIICTQDKKNNTIKIIEFLPKHNY